MKSAFLRRERDSNPRYLSVRRFSRPVQSTTLPPLLRFFMLSKEVVFPFDVAKVYQMFGLCKCLGRKMKNIFIMLFFLFMFLSWKRCICVVGQRIVRFCVVRDALCNKGLKGYKRPKGRNACLADASCFDLSPGLYPSSILGKGSSCGMPWCWGRVSFTDFVLCAGCGCCVFATFCVDFGKFYLWESVFCVKKWNNYKNVSIAEKYSIIYNVL